MSIVHAPNKVASLTLSAIEEFIANRDDSLRTFTPLDRAVTMSANTLTVIAALSSNWKTGFMKYMANELVQRVRYDGNECVVMVTWEDSIERYGLSHLASHMRMDTQDILRGKFDEVALRQAVVELGARPVYLIGHSEATRKERPSLTMRNICDALRRFENDTNMKIKAVFLDYIQRMEGEKGISEKRLQCEDNANMAKDLSLMLNTAVVMGTQVTEEVAKRDMKIPQMGDAAEAPSAIRWAADTMIGLWRPKATGNEGSVSVGGYAYAVTPDLLLAQVTKQKFGNIGDVFALSVDFAQNKVVGEYTKG
jgi:replicative DNA helicase